MSNPILNLPLRADSHNGTYAVIVNADGNDLFSNQDENVAMFGSPETAAEIVRRVNLHDELVEALRYLGNEQNWIDSDDGLTLKRPGGGRQAGIVLYSHDIKPWAFLRDLLAKVEAR